MEPTRPTRRAFDLFLLGGMGLCYGAAFLAGAIRFLWPVPEGRRKERQVVGPAEEFRAGRVERVAFNGRQVYVLFDRAGQEFRALDATCTHLSCNVNWKPEEQKFRCPCHQGLFSPSGERLAGPPDKPLAPQPFEVDSQGRLVLLAREQA